MAFNLQKVLKALLLSSSQPLAIKDIQAAFTRFHEQQLLPGVERAATPEPAAGDPAAPAPTPVAEEAAEVLVEPAAGDPELYLDVPSLVTATQIREAMDAIAAQLRAAGDGLLLIEGNAGYRLVTEPRFARWVRILRQEPPPVKLTQSALETLAVIAYRQPVTRTEIENIRGVSAEAGLNKLLERDLVYIVGRADTPGRPIQYGTTDDFLEFTGIKSLDELPASDVLSSRQIDEWLRKTESTKAPGDLEMGLPDEQLPLEAPLPTPPAEEPVPPADESAVPTPVAESPAPSTPPSA
jgi:segregation and condensation protein B